MSQTRWDQWTRASFALLGAIAFFLASATASAQVATCQSPTDCDNDGINNFDDACPALDGNTAQPGPAGFVAIACYLPLIPGLEHCIPAAARAIDEFVADDPYTPIGSGTRRKGFNYVGVFDRAAGGPAAAAPYLNQASPSSIGAPGVLFRSNALFACLGSIEFDRDGTLKPHPAPIYGFRVASTYARSVNAAALRAQELGLGTFNDALGLITSIRDESVRNGIIGTGGTWDDQSRWGVQAGVLVAVQADDLPRVEGGFPTPACVDTRVPRGPRLPFGPQPAMPAAIPRALPSYVPRFGASEFMAPGQVAVVDFSGCGASGPDEIYVFYSHLVIQIPPVPIIFGIERPGQLIDFWWVDEPMVWPRAVEKLAPDGVPLKTRSMARNKFREPRPRYGPWLAAVATSTAEIAQLEGGNWTEIKGAAFSALKAADLDGRPLHFFSQANSGASRSISATLLGWQVDDRNFDFAADHWVVRYSYGAGQPKQVNVNVPLAADPDNQLYSFKSGASDAFMNILFTPDQWNPAGDYWEANASGRCKTLPQRYPATIAPNPSMSVPDQWCPRAFTGQTANVLESYRLRRNLCNPDTIDMSNANSHWPLLERDAPFATLFGHLNAAVAPTAKFPDNDLVFTGIANNGRRLHEGVDINWEMMEEFADPTTRQIFGKYEPEHCWGELAVSGGLQMPISCSDENIRLCGNLAGPGGPSGWGCNPTELAWERWKRDQADACSCETKRCGGIFDWFCTIVNCAANTVANCIAAGYVRTLNLTYGTFAKYFGTVCTAWNGSQPCGGADAFNLHRDTSYLPGKRRMENELEYNVAFGVHDLGLGTQGDCAGNVGVVSTCDWSQRNTSYEHKNWVYLEEDRNLASVGTTQEGEPIRDFFREPTVETEVWPFVFGPGLFQSRRGPWGRMATIAGNDTRFAEYDNVPKIQILPPEVLDLLRSDRGRDHPFRLEMLGDLIVDCGHNPLRPEIHPPTGVYMHLGGPGRYSIFGWHRTGPAAGAPLELDLWPATPKPHAAAQLAMNIVFDQGIDVDVASAGGVWICSKYPAEAPDHFRCILNALGRSATDACKKNPRMLPSCEDGIAGGIVEVSWQ